MRTNICGIALIALLMIVSWPFADRQQPGVTYAEPAQRLVARFQTTGVSRGYQTTPQELRVIAAKASQGIQPYKNAVEQVLAYAAEDWNFDLDPIEICRDSDDPAWIDDRGGIEPLYAKALAYHLTSDESYAAEVKSILSRIMMEVQVITLDHTQCQLNFSWGTPELVASADLIEEYWYDDTCTGPMSTVYGNPRVGSGNCKELFQNWLAKNPYYIVSYAAEGSKSNWGAAATNTLAYIADYLLDRSDITLVHRYPPELNSGIEDRLTPLEAYHHANDLALNRMNGYGVELMSSRSCDYLDGPQQSDDWEPVKSQLNENGIVTEDARREEYCNIPAYNGEYQNYPQIHLNNNIQQCELMLRRGDSSCFDNVNNTDVPEFNFRGPDGKMRTTHLYPGRGSIERAINAIIVDSGTEWRHDDALEVAYRYYLNNHRLGQVGQWYAQLGRRSGCSQGLCFGTLTHGFAEGETPELPPVSFLSRPVNELLVRRLSSRLGAHS